MNEIKKIPAVIMRGGTSKGIYIKSNHLPADKTARDRCIMAIFGSPDVRQIDGLGGADPLTSKLAIIGPPSHPEADIDYTFAQVGIDQPVVDYGGNCGNISAGVGPFAIDEGFVAAVEPVTKVKIHNTNTGKILIAEVEVEGGRARTEGDCRIGGVPGSGSRIMLNFAGTAGSATGKLLPTGNVVDQLVTPSGTVEVSIIDCANPMVFVRAEDMGIEGIEPPAVIDGNKQLLARLEEIRSHAAVVIGMADDPASATAKSPAFPMIAMVSKAREYQDFTTGKVIKSDDVSFVSRLMFMQVLHKTYAGTGTVCTGAAAKIPGTIVNQVIDEADSVELVRIGHPAGVIAIEAKVVDGKVERAAFARTARRIMEGSVLVQRERIRS
ncbi:2-methylaconitate cis-trans isomerase PrpF family protein [Desulforhopalus singaporensis]|uniref:Methylitaconate delta2-delta3-isomerase n=1 Tax=Desulforhopalus singaporensis TaxID=91360 RepID=A0A1H0N820_9BACT|nr:PrpF domain-containing protein [Desulforhopalus singaporensis]SDO88480.1 methylitaconate delta2-delta3-isomerase [Desulforhopalus singaporensis]